MHLGPPVLDKVERSWSCWRHPNASGVGLKVAGAMETVGLTKPKATFWRGGVAQCGADATSTPYFWAGWTWDGERASREN